jgi:hypothetical protein
MTTLFGGEEGALGDVLSIGDNFAIPVEVDNKEGVDFYILQCQHTKFIMKEAFECIWGGRFEAGNSVVAGTYYQRWGRSNKSYVYLSDSRITYVSADLVKACKASKLQGERRQSNLQDVSGYSYFD